MLQSLILAVQCRAHKKLQKTWHFWQKALCLVSNYCLVPFSKISIFLSYVSGLRNCINQFMILGYVYILYVSGPCLPFTCWACGAELQWAVPTVRRGWPIKRLTLGHWPVNSVLLEAGRRTLLPAGRDAYYMSQAAGMQHFLLASPANMLQCHENYKGPKIYENKTTIWPTFW